MLGCESLELFHELLILSMGEQVLGRLCEFNHHDTDDGHDKDDASGREHYESPGLVILPST